jgi:hypothetical protein
MPEQYDAELGDVTWHVVLYDSSEEKPNLESRYQSQEITPEMAESVARRCGYDYFEIVRTQTDIRRYNVGGARFSDALETNIRKRSG